ncbi:MAG TPA: prenyltransferase [Methanoregulaceae archaeon]|nr:prenyltransferase [Methanoregulaceae archaeon]
MTGWDWGAAGFAIRLSRPRFWIYTGGTFVVGYSIGMADWHAFLILAYAVALFYFFVPANLFVYGINDLFDEETDRNNPKKGAREYRFSASDRSRIVVLVILTLAASALLAAVAPDPRLIAVLGGFLFLSCFYSAPPFRFKQVPFLDFTSNVLYLLPGVYGFVLASGSAPPAWLLLGGFFHIAAMHLFSAIPDIACDRAAGITTTAVLLGRRTSLFVCLAFWSGLSVIVLVASGLHPLALLVLAYPSAPALLILRPGLAIEKVYWRLPLLNTILGGLLFCAMVVSKGVP